MIKESPLHICFQQKISFRYVLTAAHCNQVPFTFVRLGYTNLYSSSFNDIGVDYEIEEFIAHNQYDEDHHDIGLIRLKDFVMYDLIENSLIKIFKLKKIYQVYRQNTSSMSLADKGD